MSYWFPKLQATGVPVPRTELLRTDCDLLQLLEGKTPGGYGEFLFELVRATERISREAVFLRTGHTSGKHHWGETCLVRAGDPLQNHVKKLVEISAGSGEFALPTNVWAARELLPLDTRFTAFFGMPIAVERRHFIEGGQVVCDHPYWPAEAFEYERAHGLVAGLDDLLLEMGTADTVSCAMLRAASQYASRAFQGAWSLDWARDIHGTWWALDMSPACCSYHWPGCPHEGRMRAAPVPEA